MLVPSKHPPLPEIFKGEKGSVDTRECPLGFDGSGRVRTGERKDDGTYTSYSSLPTTCGRTTFSVILFICLLGLSYVCVVSPLNLFFRVKPVVIDYIQSDLINERNSLKDLLKKGKQIDFL